MKAKSGKSKPLEYPKRKPYFANLVIRLMAKSGAAQVIGADGVWLVAAVAIQEDTNRYTGPVTFWNSQLCPILGIATWRRLAKVRERAIEAGWLVYQGEPQGHMPGKYFARIPDGLETPEILSDLERDIGLGQFSICQNDTSAGISGSTSHDTSSGIPTDTSSSTPSISIDQNSTSHGISGGRGGGGSICQNDTSVGISSYPVPVNTNTTPPTPLEGGDSRNSDPGKNSGGGKSRKAASAPPSVTEAAQCESLYQAYPRHSHKGKALEAILKALRNGVPFNDLLKAVKGFAEAVRRPPQVDWGRVPHPASWFNANRWEDDPETWKSVGRQGHEYEARARNFNPGQVQARSNDERNRNTNGGGRKVEPFPSSKPPSDRDGSDGAGGSGAAPQ